MIDFKEIRCAALLERLESLLWAEDEKLSCRNDLLAQAVVDAFTIDDARDDQKAAVSAHAKALRDRAISGISVGEMASWPIKIAEAETYAAKGEPEKAPLLSREAAARGVALADLVARVKANAAALSALEADISGIEGKHRDAISALGDIAEVDAYDWHTGWPNL